MSLLFFLLFGIPMVVWIALSARPLLGLGAARPESAEAILKALAAEAGGDWLDDNVIALDLRGRRVLLGLRTDDDEQLFPVVTLAKAWDVLGPTLEVHPPVHAFAGDPRDHLRVRCDDPERIRRLLASDIVVERLANLLPHGQQAEVTLDSVGTLSASLPHLPPYRDVVLAALDAVVALTEALSPGLLASPQGAEDSAEAHAPGSSAG